MSSCGSGWPKTLALLPDGATPATTISSYTVVNDYAEYRPITAPHLMLRLDVDNLFDETYASRGTYGQDIKDVLPLYQPDRSFVVAASAKF